MAVIKGGDKLAAALRELSKKVSKAGTLQVGFLEGATYPDGVSVPMVAAVQEFGAPSIGIPPRPYFRTMVAAKSPTWGKAISDLLIATNYDTEKTLENAGQGIKGQLQQSIIDTNSPALSPITLMLRKMRSEDQSLVVTGKTVGEAARRVAAGESTAGVSTKVLDDTGYMLSRVDYRVK